MMLSNLPTERLATTVVFCGILIVTCQEFLLNRELYTSLVITVLCSVAVLFLSFTVSPMNSAHRKNAAVGYLCCPLLPVCLLISQGSDGLCASHKEMFALGSLIISVLVSAWTVRADSYNVMWLLAMTAVSIASVIWISTSCAISQEFLLTCASLVVQLYLFQVLQNNLPQSFTVGELTIVTQGISAFLLHASLVYLSAAKCVLNAEPLTSSVETTIFIQTAVVSCSIVVLVLFVCDVFHSPVLYYALVIAVAGVFAFPVLTFYFQRDFISWLVRFICRGYDKMFLFAYWTLWCFGLWPLTYWNTSRAKQYVVCASLQHQEVTGIRSGHGKLFSEPHSSLAYEKHLLLNSSAPSTCSDDQRSELMKLAPDEINRLTGKNVTHGDHSYSVNSGSTAESIISCGSSTIVRKQFHVVAVAIFVPGLFYDSQLLYMASTCALVVLIMIETLRILGVPPLGTAINECFAVFIDERDGGKIITTHLYLLIGCSCPLWIYNGIDKPLALYSGILSLGIGDTCASVFGSQFGRHKWLSSPKSVEGSIASFISQLLFAYVIDMSGYVSTFRYSTVGLAFLLNTLLEAFTSQIDNLVLPLFTYLLISTLT